MSARWSATVDPVWDFDAWRAQARLALRANIAPDAIDWHGDAQGGLLAGRAIESASPVREVPAMPRDFFDLAARVVCHRDADAPALLYRMAWRIANGERHLCTLATDIDTHRAMTLDQSVRRDLHKMKAFVRFREVPGVEGAFIAWFEPEHHIVDRVSGFFERRFAGMRWSILTPYRSVHWNGEALVFAPGAVRSDAPADDAQESLWRTYYAHIFNPARLNPRMMRQEMPQKYWKHLPEAHVLPTLLREAGARVEAMAERMPQPPRRRIPEAVPAVDTPAGDLDTLRTHARDCRACPLWGPATQTVFGEGPTDARIVVVGEQPGDQEDLSGRPFVGPAGKLLQRALDELGIARDTLYLTNAVKHFRFERRGKHRLHKAPEPGHARACRQWLARELELLQPDTVVCLGATAASSVLGADFKLMQQRGQWERLSSGARAFATVHPAWVLRQPAAQQEAAYRGFVEDLRLLIDRRNHIATAASTSATTNST
ncbi:Uracil-DNA glycosylase family protein [Lysobacter dokdonensis DS-58]|uniref:Type-4 uracil-DNA glycosylase n=1 Tax=Lysobacter dokdonensis DS-58 TaxID=1300345 RepID=A0A0A2WHL4_9GAMM|nr:UdgX family uracil-DNA binding protein [Lysobacter dokdonensis]KGQ19303.1 Uracil-DNA glycosylase family protein [Lysobacter dokdonensis DS-58]